MFSPGLGKKQGIPNAASVLPKRRSGRGLAQLLVAVRGASVPLRLCYAADPTAERGCLEPAARSGENNASSSERGGEIVSRRLQVFIPTGQRIIRIKDS